MLILLLNYLLISNAVTTKQEKSILYSRLIILGLVFINLLTYNNLYLKPLEKGIGIYGSLFNISVFTQSFNMFIVLIGSFTLILTAFYPRKIFVNNYTSHQSEEKLNNKILFNSEIILNNKSEQFLIIEYGLIIVFILCGAIFLMSTGDLISLFLSIELQSYGLYILSTLYRDSESATGSALTYFLLGGLSSCFILFGSSLLYVNSGTTNLDNMYIIISISELSDKFLFLYQSYYFHFSLIVLSVGFLFKISAAPFHFWSPDVYDGIPTIVTTFVAVVAKISIFVILLQLVLYTEYNYLNTLEHSSSINITSNQTQFKWKDIFIFSSFMSLIVGSLLGLAQYRIKRVFAYSTISHIGFILLALCVNKIESVQGYIFYILQYSLSNLNAFIILVTIGFTLYFYSINSYEIHTPKIIGENHNDYRKEYSNLIDLRNSPIQLLTQLKGYFYINSYISISLAITLFSFVGIPPLIGFFAKQMVLSAALDEGYVFITLLGIITSVIGAVYYLNIIKLMFFYKSDYNLEWKPYLDISPYSTESIYNPGENSSFVNPYVTINSALSVVISVFTLLISLFIYTPGEWFSIITIIVTGLFNI